MKKTFTFKLIIIVCILSLISLTGCSHNNKDNSTPQPSTLAQTTTGPVSGEIINNVLTFKGIPFAQAPTGDLRLAPPQEMNPWTEPLECTDFTPAPPQIHSNNSSLTYDEDCLYLNLWAPENALINPAKKNLPVLVYIHGGAFATGTSSNPTYNGSAFAKDGVIQVNLEYRLNALGFLALKEAKDATGYLGNIGILDQIAGLKWVKENIANFGGDPNNITISGESAGSMSVSNLIISPLAKNLFTKAIMESGTFLEQPILSPTFTGNKDQAISLSESFKQYVGASTMADLRSIDVDTLVESSKFSTDMTSPNHYNFFPVFDGVILPEDPYTALKSGEFNDIDVLIGYNSHEGTMFVPENITIETYITFVKNIFGENSDEILSIYPVDDKNSPTDQARKIITAAFQIGCYTFSDELSKQGKNVYLYNFDYSIPSLEAKGLGVMHGLELYFVFDTIPSSLKLSKGENKFQKQVHNYWISFIRSGDPNNEHSGFNWPKYDYKKGNLLRLGNTIEQIPAPNKSSVDYLLTLLWN